MPLQYPLNGITAPRAEHFLGRARNAAEVRAFTGMRDAMALAMPGVGIYSFAPGCEAEIPRALSGARDPSDGHRIAQVNRPRYLLADFPGGLMANGGGGGLGTSWGLGAEDGLLIEPLRQNRCPASASGLTAYSTGSASGTRTASTDPVLGGVLRINKTGGASGDAYGGRTIGTLLNVGGSSYCSGMLVRPYNSIGSVTIYTDASASPSGLITTSIVVPLSRLVRGQWNLIMARGYTSGRTLLGGFTTYAWLEGGTGGDCDVAQITTTSGGTTWLGSTMNNAGTVSQADAPALRPAVAFDGASGMIAMRVYVPAAHRGITVTTATPARVYFQRRDGSDGIRIASEDGRFVTLTMTNGGNTNSINQTIDTSISAGWHTFAWRWDQDAGILAFYQDGALVSQTTGIPSGHFPSGVVGGDLLLGHSGSGAQNLCSAVGWVTHHPSDPGATEALAASASSDPRHTAANLWNFRQRQGIRAAAYDDGLGVLLPSAWHGVWSLTAPSELPLGEDSESLARVRRMEAAVLLDPASGRSGALDQGLLGLRASETPSLGTINAGTEASFTATVIGAEVGMLVTVAPPSNLNTGISVRGAVVEAPNTVRVYLRNDTAGNLAPPSGTWRLALRKAAP